MHYVFCDLCRINHDHGKGHRYTRKHREAVDHIIEKVRKAAKLAIDNAVKVDISTLVENDADESTDESVSFQCPLTGELVSLKKRPYKGEAELRYLSSQRFREQVLTFLQREGGGDEYDIDSITVNQQAVEKFEKKCEKWKKQKKKMQAEQLEKEKEAAASEEAEKYLRELEREQIEQAKARTVWSSRGIPQHPSGMHSGQRVWGGGIVPLPPSAWIPWDIDKSEMEEVGEGKEETGQDIHQEQDRGIEVEEVAMQTLHAYSDDGLTCLKSPILKPGYRNVHAGGVPPWMDNGEQVGGVDVPEGHEGPALPPSWKKERIPGSYRQEEKEAHRTRKDDERWRPDFGGVFSNRRRKETVQAASKPGGGRGQRRDGSSKPYHPYSRPPFQGSSPPLPFEKARPFEPLLPPSLPHAPQRATQAEVERRESSGDASAPPVPSTLSAQSEELRKKKERLKLMMGIS